jgi:hypothetical protein
LFALARWPGGPGLALLARRAFRARRASRACFAFFAWRALLAALALDAKTRIALRALRAWRAWLTRRTFGAGLAARADDRVAWRAGFAALALFAFFTGWPSLSRSSIANDRESLGNGHLQICEKCFDGCSYFGAELDVLGAMFGDPTRRIGNSLFHLRDKQVALAFERRALLRNEFAEDFLPDLKSNVVRLGRRRQRLLRCPV